MYVCQFPLAAYYGKVVRARMVKFSHKIRPVQPFVVLKFLGCATDGVHMMGASLPHFGAGGRSRNAAEMHPSRAHRLSHPPRNFNTTNWLHRSDFV